MSSTKEIKLLIVDDSAFMRQLIKDLLATHKNIKTEAASNGKLALQKIKEFKPDIITLDIEMNIMDGLELLEVMKNENIFIPTIMLSRLTQKNGEITMKALDLGAIDFISKPESNLVSLEFDKLATELFDKINVALNVSKRPTYTNTTNKEPVKIKSSFIIPKVLVIGSSTGGPGALFNIFSRLPKVNIPIIIIQHMPAGFTDSLAKRLNDINEMTVKVAENNEIIKPSTVYLAPGDYHLTLNLDNRITLDNKSSTYKGVRPSYDIALKSIAKVFGGRILTVILTGMGNDGSEGIDIIKKLGGKCIAQDKESCVVFGMPESVISMENADSVTPLNKIPEEIVHYLMNWN